MEPPQFAKYTFPPSSSFLRRGKKTEQRDKTYHLASVREDGMNGQRDKMEWENGVRKKWARKTFLILTKVVLSLHSSHNYWFQSATSNSQGMTLPGTSLYRRFTYYLGLASLAGCGPPRLSPPLNGDRWGQNLHLRGLGPLRHASCKCQKHTLSWYSSADPGAICSLTSVTLNSTWTFLSFFGNDLTSERPGSEICFTAIVVFREILKKNYTINYTFFVFPTILMFIS